MIVLGFRSTSTIYVQYVSVPPTVSLDIGKALNLNDLEEGDDVYFECSISANPPPYKVTWLHNVTKSHQVAASCNKNLSQGKEILQKPEMQIFVSNQSLVLQKVSIFLAPRRRMISIINV